jgi:hypothetical protein
MGTNLSLQYAMQHASNAGHTSNNNDAASTFSIGFYNL